MDCMEHFNSIKSRLFILLFLAILPGIGTIFFQAYTEHKQILANAEHQATQISKQIANAQKKIITDTQLFLKHLANTRTIQQNNIAQCNAFLADIIHLNPLYTNIGIPLANGDLLCNAYTLADKVNVFDREYFQRSLKNKRFAISEFQYDRFTQDTSINFAYPIVAKDQSVQALAVAVVSLDWWSKNLTSFELPSTARAHIFDAEDSIVASYPFKAASLGTSRQAFNFSTNVSDKSDITTEILQGQDGIIRAYTHSKLFQIDDDRYVTMSIGIPFDEAVRKANRKCFLTLISFSIIALLLVCFTVRILRLSILNPIETLNEATQSLAKGQLSKFAISKHSTNELRNLQQCFWTMANKRLEIEQEKNSRNEELNSVFKALPDHFLRLNPQGVILDCKGSTVLENGQKNQDLTGQHICSIFPSKIADKYCDMLKKNSDLVTTWEYALTIQNQEHVFEARMSNIENSEERVVVVRNITQRKKRDKRIWEQAHYDSLTNLPNRSLLYDRTVHAIEEDQKNSLQTALLFLDLDHFKDINDTLGHSAGDLLLQQVASRLKRCIDQHATLARQGGDEFTLLLSHLTTLEYVPIVAQRILDSLSKPFKLNNEMTYISVSIGIAIYPNDSNHVDDLFTMADQAMYAAKASGRNSYKFFTQSMQLYAQTRMQTINDLRQAIEQQQFVLYYQPIVELASATIQKAEALIRWQHPTKGLISPDDFIAIAEETHLIIDIGEWVFQQALEDSKYCIEHIYKQFQISVNVSPVQFSKPESGIEHWCSQMNETGFKKRPIVMEITENLLMDASKETEKRLNTFSDKGIEIAIDDFGTGYSSLSYIREYDVDYLKIDQSFITNLATDSDSFALCEAIIVMAHKLGIKVIAEGIETISQREILIAMGCDYGQGYLFSPPVDFATFKQLP